MTYIEGVPAYGRDYKNKATLLADWKQGKDFQDVATGTYFNIGDAFSGGLSVVLRYGNNLKVAEAPVPKRNPKL